ncbi:ATPase 6, plasma membrane-type [Termitomyces sp. T112]|nr:ATPase 6, plasma membrane-type [Termitomyces sp. T112]
MWDPLSWVMEHTALVSIALIILLLFVNSTIGFYKEHNTENAITALIYLLAPKVKVKHNGSWSEIKSTNLFPGDMIAFKIGDIVLANGHLSKAINVSIDPSHSHWQIAPHQQEGGQPVFPVGSTCKNGEAEGVIVSAGANTFFGHAAPLIRQDDDTTGHLQKILAQTKSFCLISIGIFVITKIFCLYATFWYSYHHGLDNILVLLIGGISIPMPTDLSITLTIGAQQLAKHKAIVTHIHCHQEASGCHNSVL